MSIHYTTDMNGIDWAQMRQTLIDDNFDNGRTPEQYRLSFQNSYCCVIAFDDERLVGTARMLSDGVCNAYIVDVWTLTAYRRQGIARQMMQRLESHAQGQHISLWTERAEGFYTALGYIRNRDTLFEKIVGEWLINNTRETD